MTRFDLCLEHLLKWEGGYVDHPDDPGGATNYGITHKTLADWRGRPVTKEDVRDLRMNEVAAIYRVRYWDAVRGDDLPAGVDAIVFDAAVNHGVTRASRFLQQVVGASPDGKIGPLTLEAVRDKSAGEVIEELYTVRAGFYRSLSHFKTFGRGWINRIDDVRRFALAATWADKGCLGQ